VSLREAFWPLLGNWTGVEEQAASPWAPASSARAMVTFKLDVGDAVVVQDYRQVRADGAEFSAHGVFMLDPAGAPILWWLFDSAGQPPAVAEGEWSSSTLTLTKHTPRGAAWHRFTVDGDELAYAIEIQLGEDPVRSRFLTGRYRRISGH
ncbi:MAG TPA: DUF1579 domain-containing protein, partial [Propionibacteriaceae bacterium]